MMLPVELEVFEDATSLNAALPGAVVTGKHKFGETTLEIAPAQIVAACRYLKTARQYERLSAVTAVDRHPADPRFEIVYHFHSLARNARLRLKSRIGGAHPEIDTVSVVYLSANWYEREIFDLFGVTFRNHPDLRRIMLPEDWEGHPLRKDYPKTGPRV
jgi:NADH-quinone oxidoreductase subunit C